jgi:hypothetical protein
MFVIHYEVVVKLKGNNKLELRKDGICTLEKKAKNYDSLQQIRWAKV